VGVTGSGHVGCVGFERPAQPHRGLVLRDVVDVDHGGADVGVAHPVLPDDPQLNRHVAAAVDRHGRRGWRIDKAERGENIDGVIALCMAVQVAQAPRAGQAARLALAERFQRGRYQNERRSDEGQAPLLPGERETLPKRPLAGLVQANSQRLIPQTTQNASHEDEKGQFHGRPC